MKCPTCAHEIAPGQAACRSCGARRPPLDPRFQRVEDEYVRLRGQLDSGTIIGEAFKAAIDSKIVDDGTRFWMMGVENGLWYSHDGTQWVETEPPLAPESRMPAAVPPASTKPPVDHVRLVAAASTAAPPSPPKKRASRAAGRHGSKGATEIARLEGHTADVNSVAFSPDGRRVLSVGAWSAILWDLHQRREIRRLGGAIDTHPFSVMAAAFLPDGRRAITGGMVLPEGAILQLWDLDDGREISRFAVRHDPWIQVTTISVSADGRSVLASGDGVGTPILRIWNVDGWREHPRIEVQKDVVDDVRGADFSPDARWVLSGHISGGLLLWEAESGRRVAQFPDKKGIHGFAISPDSRQVASTALRDAEVWELYTAKPICVHHGKKKDGFVQCLAFSSDGLRVVSGNNDGIVCVWSAATGEDLHRFKAHDGPVRSVQFSPDSALAVSGGADRMVRVWELN